MQGAELAMLDQPEYTMTALIPELVEWVALAGPTELLPGVTAVPTPGHTPGHQALVVETRLGVELLAGQCHDTASEFAADVMTLRMGRGPCARCRRRPSGCQR